MASFFRKAHKILGMNSRNLEYIRPFNLQRAKKLADDKLLTKKVLTKNSIAVPELLAKIKNRDDLENFKWEKLPESFALKPNRGFGGEGILVVYGKNKSRTDAWVKADKSLVTTSDLKTHVQNILDGSYSLSGTPDVAFFEKRITLLKLFKPYVYKGIPDIRIIIFNMVPVMAMLRLPTVDSGGKANLHQGAIGVGIDLATGVTTTAIWKNKLIDYIPGTRLLVSGIKIPYWKQILELAVHAQEISHLGYLGVDIAIDKESGPIILELNARPGLAIQIANLSGLKSRLERVSGLYIKTIKKGVRVGMDLFGGEIEEELEDISGKKVIGTTEKIKLIGKLEKTIELEAKIDTGADSSSIDTSLAIELGYGDVIEYFSSLDLPTDVKKEDEKKVLESLRKKYLGTHPDLADIGIVFSSHGFSIRPKILLNFVLDNLMIPAKVNIMDRSGLDYQILIGKNNLKKFLIDVSKANQLL